MIGPSFVVLNDNVLVVPNDDTPLIIVTHGMRGTITWCADGHIHDTVWHVMMYHGQLQRIHHQGPASHLPLSYCTSVEWDKEGEGKS